MMPVGGGRGCVRRNRTGGGIVGVWIVFFARLRGCSLGSDSDSELEDVRKRLRLDRDELVDDAGEERRAAP